MQCNCAIVSAVAEHSFYLR